ncbi:hypothetical protein NMY22_g4068 [Coprinellus aureogranulatus]|nr:hypothetical protein NMY22_g4068 [Coprinellus aureogranulatus]
MASPDLSAVLVSSASITEASPATAYMKSKLVAFTNSGGTLVLLGSFAQDLSLQASRDFFLNNWGLDWTAGIRKRVEKEVRLNESNSLVNGRRKKWLPKAPQWEGAHTLTSTRSEDVVYVPTRWAGGDSPGFAQFDGERGRFFEGPVLYTRVGDGGKGKVGFVGGRKDVEETGKVVVTMVVSGFQSGLFQSATISALMNDRYIVDLLASRSSLGSWVSSQNHIQLRAGEVGQSSAQLLLAEPLTSLEIIPTASPLNQYKQVLPSAYSNAGAILTCFKQLRCLLPSDFPQEEDSINAELFPLLIPHPRSFPAPTLMDPLSMLRILRQVSELSHSWDLKKMPTVFSYAHAVMNDNPGQDPLAFPSPAFDAIATRFGVSAPGGNAPQREI